MTPEAWAAFVQFAREFGLPLAILSGFLWLFLTGRVVTKRELMDMKMQFERERADRIAAESIVAKFAPANAEVAEAVADLSKTVMTVLADPYKERLEGRGRRGG